MERIRSSALGAHVGEAVLVAGWLHALRRLGGLAFLVLRDGWGTVQVVVEEEAALEPLRQAEAGAESVLRIAGRVRAAAQAPGGVELHDPQITVLTPVREPPPVGLGKREVRAALPTLLDAAALTTRHPTRRAVFALSAAAVAGFREWLMAHHFTEVQTPKIVAAATESGANVFQLDYFGSPAFLAQSPQLYKQMLVGVFERVFEVGPVFRAEPHDTPRHVNEFVSLDVEMGFIEDHTTVMAVLRDVLEAMLEAMRTRCPAELALLRLALPEVPVRIPQLDFAEAQELLLRRTGVDVRGEPDLSPADERELGRWAAEEHGSAFLYVTGYPLAKRPFYTHPDPSRPGATNGFDLLLRGTELVSGGQRLHRYEEYVAALEARGLPQAPFAAYLQAFRYGMPPHGGFAIGLERLLLQLTGLPNIRQVTLFPRDLHRLTP